MSAFTEHLIYFPPRGYADPGEYVTCRPAEVPAYVRLGGRDVSDNQAHWRQWEQLERLDALRNGGLGW